MSDASPTKQPNVLSKEVLQTLKDMRGKLEAVNKAKTEPIAIVGMACRFPGGANDPSKYWNLLHDGIDAITPVPGERWDVSAYYDPDPEVPGKTYTKEGGFIEQVDQFDPLFFGIAPREAVNLDPQYRLLLEVTWEALENSGQTWTNLKNSQTSVFMGISTDDYSSVIFNEAKSYPTLGSNRSIGVGRISHLLGLQGSNIQVDTACSSSLVAAHLACQSLRSGESNLALVGGVNLILSPFSTIGRCQLRALSPDGRCKTFDAAANGYGQGEGCGVLVLKRLSDAVSDGDLISAVIRGSAVNHDGPSSGMTVPNRMAQKQVIQQALSNAKLEAHQISYLEAHGTGTSLGDPIEIEALAEVYGKNRPADSPLIVGSVKTNLGHLEAAAGVSSLMKVILALQHQEIPPHLHLKEPNPHVDWDKLPIKIPTSLMSWSDEEKPRIAGVSSFGMGGTNAHILLEEAPKEGNRHTSTALSDQGNRQDELKRPVHLLTLSAKTEQALEDLVSRYQTYLETDPDVAISDVCYTANTGRQHFQHRLAVMASDPKELAEKLLDWQTGQEVVGLSCGEFDRGSASSKIAFLFTGQGSQYVNMGKQLYETVPTFRQALDRCDQILQPYLDYPLLEVLYPKEEQKSSSSLLDQTAYTQPALFAIEYALFKLWESWGIKPTVVMGHSVGEYVAATVAGVFSLEEGLKLIAMRGRLMQQLPSGGEMVAAMASKSVVQEAIAEYSAQVAIAAINGPESTVISGESGAIATLCRKLEAMGIKTKPLQVSHAFHSPLMEPMLADFAGVAREVTYHQPKIKFVSNTTGQKAGNEVTKAEYWINHIRQPVQFYQSIKTLHEQGNELFLEIGPKPILLGMGSRCLPENVGVWLPSLRPGVEEWQQMLSSLGQLYVKGITVNWSGFDQDFTHKKVALPTYPFQRQRCWVERTENEQEAPQTSGNITETQVVKLLTQGKTAAIAQQLEKAVNFSPEQRKLLPELLEVLAKQHQEQLAAAAIENWFYEIQWKPLDRSSSKANLQPSHWLIFADSTGVAEKFAQKLQQQGHQYSLVYRSESYHQPEAGKYQLNPSIPEEFDQLYQDVQERNQLPLLKFIHLWSLDTPESKDLTPNILEATQLWGCGSVMHLVQTLLKNASNPQLWLVTRGSQSVLSKDNQIPGLATSPLWGLGRTVSIENPQLWGGLVDLDPQAPAEDEIERLWQLLVNEPEEDHLALRGEKTYVARLVNQKPPEFSQPLSLSSDGSYLITGGLGALGQYTAQWLVEKGAKNIVLTGRRPPSENVQETIEKLEQKGCQVKVLLGDVSLEEEIAKILEEIQTSMPRLQGIIHAAGVLDDGILQQMDWERFTKVMSPKVIGTWNLHRLTQNLPLDFFVCFSSIASLMGSPGQGNYAAANAFMDTLASYRRSMGLSGLAINWGAWASEGMAARLAVEYQNRIQSSGISEISPKEGMYALEVLLGNLSSIDRVGVIPIQWSILAKHWSGIQNSSLLRELLQKEEWGEQDTLKQNVKANILAKLETASPEERQEILIEHIRGQVVQVLGLSSSQLPEMNLGFMEIGMDSLMAVELKNRLQNQLETHLPETIAMEYPTIAKLSLYVEELMEWQAKEQEKVSGGQSQREGSEEDLFPNLEEISEEDFEALAAQQLETLKNML
ncbi:MAG: type I polyketide synthase [Roseofilum sp. SBFL]|uniref:type I polyketide synthase n=1 Tax=unclassified Roseofilum TaxID=2620099 RepID=UPI001B053F5D|nr:MULTISPECIES: type I polyketide synthase [unclassified Roseofilum]MBP0013349.1 type I polyketide synthase [Roseofilum sp. SID3]MBP0022848.1 type I polyketide synthase [Roseofilum sp. SID2]MBP0043833.1 type I polyketide synthase [Roseofilum sp. SBFL]